MTNTDRLIRDFGLCQKAAVPGRCKGQGSRGTGDLGNVSGALTDQGRSPTAAGE